MRSGKEGTRRASNCGPPTNACRVHKNHLPISDKMSTCSATCPRACFWMFLLQSHFQDSAAPPLPVSGSPPELRCHHYRAPSAPMPSLAAHTFAGAARAAQWRGPGLWGTTRVLLRTPPPAGPKDNPHSPARLLGSANCLPVLLPGFRWHRFLTKIFFMVPTAPNDTPLKAPCPAGPFSGHPCPQGKGEGPRQPAIEMPVGLSHRPCPGV